MNGENENDCRSYVAHMEREHRHLRTKLLQVRDLLHAGDREQLVRELENFKSELSHHFMEEDEGGCLEEAACHCPTLAHEVSVVQHQHRELRGEAEALLAAVRQGEAGIPARLEKFIHALDEHEHLELNILQRGFNTADVEISGEA